MATKAQKNKEQKYKEKVKESREHMKNLTPNEVAQLENYCVYQILYVNDAACNECKFLGDQLKKIPYRSNYIKKIYNALMKRVNAYWDMVNETAIDQNSLAELFSNIDDYLDKPILNLRQSIEDVLRENNVGQYEWVASVETAYTMCNFAEQYSIHLIDKISTYSTEIKKMRRIVISAIRDVAESMTKSVQEIHIGSKIDIDLTSDRRTMKAWNTLQKTVMNPHFFMDAINMADKVNADEGNMRLM